MTKALLVLWAVALAGCATSGSWGRRPDATADLMSPGGRKIGTAALPASRMALPSLRAS